MIKHFHGDISDVEVEVIVNAANRIGFMGGIIGKYIKSKGIAESIHFHTKGMVEKEAKKYSWSHRLKKGDVFITDAYNLKAKHIYHAITMTLPGSFSSFETVEKCVDNLIKLIKENNVKSIAIPLLGTGVGRVNKDKVIQLYIDKFSLIEGVEFIVVDLSKGFQKIYNKDKTSN